MQIIYLFYKTLRRRKANRKTDVSAETPTAYKSIHNAFHLSLLEPYRRRHVGEPKGVAPNIVDSKEQWEVKNILAHKTTCRKDIVKYKYSVLWLGVSQ